MAAIRASGDDGVNAVLAHVGEGHWRAWFAAHGVRRLMEDEVQGNQEGTLHSGTAKPVVMERRHRSDGILMTAEY
jgi:hypothetical protein